MASIFGTLRNALSTVTDYISNQFTRGPEAAGPPPAIPPITATTVPSQGPLDLNNTSTFGVRRGGLPDQKFVYTVRVGIVDRFGNRTTQNITLRSANVLDEAQITTEVFDMFETSQQQRYQGSIEDIAITNATRPESMGGI